MKSLSRGTVVLATTVALWACSGDPTDSFRGEAADIVVSPTSVFVDRGESRQVIVEVIDQQGNPLVEEITISGGTGITVAPDPNYLPAPGGHLDYEKAFIVTGNDLVSTAFTVEAAGVSRDVSVRVVPTALDIPAVSVASTGPNATDPTVLTIPAPYLFIADSAVLFDAGAAITVDQAEDGRSITILPPPGTTSTGAVTVAVDYIPEVPLASTTDVPLAISTTVPPMAGTGDPATAPVITIPPPGGSGGFFDAGTYGAAVCGDNTGAPCQLYKFTLAEETTFDLNTSWSNTADMGFYFTTEDGTTDVGGTCDDHANGADAQPEHCEVTLGAGTYLLTVVSYGPFYTPADPNPTWVGVSIKTLAP